MMSFVPNVIDADAFDTQAAVDESTLTGERYTWRREPGTTLMKPGLVVSGEPALAFPYPTSAKEKRLRGHRRGRVCG
jgi:hypothetical protein